MHLWLKTVGALALLLTAANSAAVSGSTRFALVHVSVIDVVKGTIVPDQTVLISGERIVRIGNSGKGKVPTGYTAIDASGRYLLPGLWDMHVHLAGLSADPAWSKQLLVPLLVAHGITGVRDMGGDLAVLKSWRAEIRAGVYLGPEIVAAGLMLNDQAFDPNVRVIASPSDVEASIAAIKKQGADFVKVMSGLSAESFDAIVKSAKKHHLPLAGHVPPSVSLQQASASRMRTVEHILYGGFLLAASDDEPKLRDRLAAAFQTGRILDIGRVLDDAERTYNPQRASAMWQELKKNGTAVVPTLVSVQTLATMDRVLEPGPYSQYLPQYLVAAWSKQKAQARASTDRLGWYKKELSRELKIVGELQRAGVLLLAGSDALDPYDLPGESLHRELELMVQAGLTPNEALQTSTLNPAIVLGRLNDLGTVSPGKFADLVMLDDNPLDEITNTRKISGVFLRGKFLSRSQLDSMLETVRRRAAEVRR
ncbi:MAG: amidohydrolase family protein [Acidobacteriales bacterium]|nr:amidohydrolase family protein [Terriglobales bacterium]